MPVIGVPTDIPGWRIGAAVALLAMLIALGIVLSSVLSGSDRPMPEGRSGGSLNVPSGQFRVPSAAQAVDSSHPNRIVGNGTPASCTSAAVVNDVAEGGVIRFDCGPKPITILMTSTARVNPAGRSVVLDGGDLVTLSGGGKRRILFSDTCDLSKYPTGRNCLDQSHPSIVVQNITFTDGDDETPQTTCTADVPKCAYGGVDGGGAVYVEGGQFKAVDSRFVNNSCYAHGPDLGGGAIRALGQYRGQPIYLNNDSFTGGSCSNGGALSSISVSWRIFNSSFVNNRAIGFGANPAQPGTLGGGSGGAIYLDGRSFNALVAGSVMSNNVASEGGGAVFDVVDFGIGTLTFEATSLRHNVSEKFQTSPGVFFQVDQRDMPAKFLN